MLLFLNFWREWIIISLLCIIWLYDGAVSKRNGTIATLTSKSKVLEIQKDALIVGVKIQNDEIEKQHIDAVQRAEVFKMKSQSINAKFESYKARMRDLNESEECTEMKRLIEGAV